MYRNGFLLSRTKSSIAFKSRHHQVPITPYRSASLLRRDVTETHIAGKAYTLPRRHQQQLSPLRSFAGYSPAGAATPPLPATRLVTTSGDGGLTVWLGDGEDPNVVDERLSPSTARCTCTLRRVVATRPPVDVSQTAAVFRGLGSTDTPTSFTTFKPAAASTSTVADIVRAPPLARPSISDCGTFYDRPLVTSQRDDIGAGSDYGPKFREKPAK